MPSKGTQTIWKAGEWNEELESNVWSECSPENSAKHDNKGQSRNFAHKFVCSWLSDFTAPDFTVLSEVAAVTVPHRETTETFYKLSQIVCVRADSSDTRQLFIMACLQENVSVGMKRVKAKAFIQDPFNPVLFTEDAERYVDVSNIVYALTCYNFREDTHVRGWRRWSYPSPWCDSPYQWSRHCRRGSWVSCDDRKGSGWSKSCAYSKEKKEAVRNGFFLLWIER